MWFDRFSARETRSASPDPQSRSFSPASRRPTHLAPGPLPPRPGVTPRASTLSLVSNASSSNAPPNDRLLNGSNLKTQLSTSPPADVVDPLDVLKGILGDVRTKTRAASRSSVDQGVRKPDASAEDIDFGELSLQEFADQGSSRADVPSADVHTFREQSVVEYEKEKDKFEDLHRSISACDEVLKTVESYLTSFQADLGVVSAEIETLQSRSTALNTKLENRKTVEKVLGPAVEQISIPPAIVTKIIEGPIDHGWDRALQELEKRAKVLEERSKGQEPVRAVDDLKPVVENLINKALERIRDHFVSSIKALRGPNVNAQIIQQEGFLQYKSLFAFLAQHQPQLADDIAQAYVNTMRWYYTHSFARYHASLSKMKLYVMDSHNVLGANSLHNSASNSRSINIPGGSKSAVPLYDAFSLGRRSDILKSSNTSALPSHLAEEDKGTHYLEVPFRAFNRALIDNASFEYSFLTSFFSSIPKYTLHHLSTTFATIFAPTFSLGTNFTKSLIDSSADAIGALICVRLTQSLAFELQRRKVPTVESYINGSLMLLWPRFQQVMDLHLTSLHQATSSLPSATRGNAASAALSSLTSSSSPQHSSNQQSTAPHPLTQRFASFISALLTLSSDAGDDGPIANSLARLRTEYEAYMTKASKGMGEQKRRERFLANQWEFVVTVLQGVRGRLAEEMRRHFEELRGDIGK